MHWEVRKVSPETHGVTEKKQITFFFLVKQEFFPFVLQSSVFQAELGNPDRKNTRLYVSIFGTWSGSSVVFCVSEITHLLVNIYIFLTNGFYCFVFFLNFDIFPLLKHLALILTFCFLSKAVKSIFIIICLANLKMNVE